MMSEDRSGMLLFDKDGRAFTALLECTANGKRDIIWREQMPGGDTTASGLQECHMMGTLQMQTRKESVSSCTPR
jgi:hypothetical protein